MTPKEQFKIALSLQVDGSKQILVAMNQYAQENAGAATAANRYKNIICQLELVLQEFC